MVYINPVVGILLGWLGIRLLAVLADHVPGVFEEWDAVASWNRWATDWYAGRWPSNTYGYPQLIPALWSVTYHWLGSSQVEIFARGLMGLFPVAILAVFVDLFFRWRRPAPLLSAALFIALLLGPYANVLDSGYVDVPVTFFVLFTGYLVYLSAQNGMAADRLLTYAATAAATAVLCKQGGLFAVVIFLGGLVLALAGCLQLPRDTRGPIALRTLAVFMVLALPWFAMRWLQLAGGPEETNVHYVTSLIYGGETRIQRLLRALTVTLPSTFLPTSSVPAAAAKTFWAFAAGCMFGAFGSPRGRVCLLVGLPYLLVWGLFFSYDARNLLPGIPFLLLAMALGLERLLSWMPSMGVWSGGSTTPSSERCVNQRLKAMTRLPALVPPTVLAVVVLVGLVPADPIRFERLTDILRQRSGDAEFNQRLIKYTREVGFKGQVLTTYTQMLSIAALRSSVYVGHWRLQRAEMSRALAGGRPFCEILRTIWGQEVIGYALLHTSIYPAITDAALADGSLQLIFASPSLRFMSVHCTSQP